MRNLKLYLETSVWNFYFADDAPEKRDVTRQFFKNLPSTGVDTFISDFVFQEIARAEEMTRRRLEEFILGFHPRELEYTDEVQHLADEYLRQGVVPAKSVFDALHIACASVYEIDFVVSWNLKHIANIYRQEKAQAINLLNGYTKPIQLITPFEVSYDGYTED